MPMLRPGLSEKSETPHPRGMTQPSRFLRRESFLHRHPVASYFALTFAVSLFSPTRVSARQEVFWYAVYAAVLGIVVALLALVYGRKSVEPAED
jgi:hypothetical protein